MQEVNKNFIIAKYKAGNRILSTVNPNLKWGGGFALELKWLNELGVSDWKQIGDQIWELIR